MLLGGIFYTQLGQLVYITQVLIFLILLIAYSNISLKEVRFTKLHLYLIIIQLVGSVIVYLLIATFDLTVAQGTMICILAPTATSAIVVTGMLGGNTASLTAYCLLSNLSVVVGAPLFFSVLGRQADVSFWGQLFHIGERVFLLLLVPFIVSILINRFLPAVHLRIKKAQPLSFLLWNIAIIVATAKTVYFLMLEVDTHLKTAMWLFFFALLVCVFQFYIGRRLGRKFNDTVAGGQGLGQKNTILAIWMAQSYLEPISSIAPGAYILWQNIINSYQVWRKQQHN
jgi:BASS family bile acid:Na+ symporter